MFAKICLREGSLGLDFWVSGAESPLWEKLSSGAGHRNRPSQPNLCKSVYRPIRKRKGGTRGREKAGFNERRLETLEEF